MKLCDILVHVDQSPRAQIRLDIAAELARQVHGREAWRAVNDLRVLRRYERARKADLALMGGATDGLQLLFGREGAWWKSLRRWGMDGFDRSGPLKQWAARQAMGRDGLTGFFGGNKTF